jgi:ABC-type multidrug transport system ATPase subunit
MPGQPIVEVQGIAVRRPGALILRDVDLRVEPGETVGLFGANGSGKSTLLRVLATLERPTAGTGTVLGAALGTEAVESIRPRLALVAHEAALLANLSLEENLWLFAALGGRGTAAVATALTAVGLTGAAGRRVAVCSNGMKRRAEFARVALADPDLLLLDEAHVGLDSAAGTLMERMIATVTGRNGAVILVSHERERVDRLIDRSVTLVDGRLGGGR